MKAPAIGLSLLVLFTATVALAQQAAPALSIRQRGQMVFKALEAKPADQAALAKALADVGHVEAEFRSEPLKKWVEGARVIGGQICLTNTVALNRDERGPAPQEWITKLTGPLAHEQQLVVLKLAIAPTPEVRAQRDALLARADAKVRAGLLELAKTYPQLEKTNWGTQAEALEGASPAGKIVIWAGHYSGGSAGLKTPVPKADRYNVFVVLCPILWPVPQGEWAMNQAYPGLALMGQVHADAGDPELRAALSKLVADALAPLERLSDQATGAAPATQPATQPAGES